MPTLPPEPATLRRKAIVCLKNDRTSAKESGCAPSIVLQYRPADGAVSDIKCKVKVCFAHKWEIYGVWETRLTERFDSLCQNTDRLEKYTCL